MLEVKNLGFSEALRAIRILSRRRTDEWKIFSARTGAYLAYVQGGYFICQSRNDVDTPVGADMPLIRHEWLEANDWTLIV